jgi:pyrimidine-nucleoside phosphorylase
MQYMPNVINVIEAKRDGRDLSFSQIRDVVDGYTSGEIPDYQMSAFLMAVCLRGMSDDETIFLTRAMLETGETLDLSQIPGLKLDKHSTGGVGDKVSLALVPIVAAAGIPIAKMSGRGLGNTGGTLDKLESISGFRVELTAEQIIQQIKSVGGCLCGQTEKIVPADKKMYALRDVTGTVESISLIAASIMSKKLAGGADIILLDIKVGRGAFMKNIDDARKLAFVMRTIAAAFGKTVICELTNMDIPLGRAVGNLIEVWEVAKLLRGPQQYSYGFPIDERLYHLIVDLSNAALSLAGSSHTAVTLLEDGSAWQKFGEIVEAQGGDVNSIERWGYISPIAVVGSPNDGYVTDIDAEAIGRLALTLGAGRTTKDGPIDHLAGLWINAPIGSVVQKGTPLVTLYGRPSPTGRELNKEAKAFFTIGDEKPLPPSSIIEIIPDEIRC